jgi:deazaflavin-dependent oxidoreductase (nitroreductase family)
MDFRKTPGGTRGARMPPMPGGLARLMSRMMMRQHRRKGDTFQGMNLLYLTTVGAKSGEKRQSAVAWFPDGDDAWLVVASAAGAAHHPAWYHNIAAHPDQVRVTLGDRELRVIPEQLDGERREQAWQRIIASQPRYAGYQQKTDRSLPVIRLTPAP